MKKHSILLIILVIFTSQISYSAKSFKRGVSENSFVFEGEFIPMEPGVSWYYTWGNTMGNIRNLAGEKIDYTGMEFIPMCWNENYDSDKIRTYCNAHPATKYLLGFNEPNFKAQANMTPAQAAAQWPAVQALAKELNLKLVGPAVNYSPDGADNDPYTWYSNFVKLVGLDAFDYIAIHNYSGGKDGMKNMIDKFYDLYGKQIWVTEFCNWPGETSGAAIISVDTQVSSMISQLEYLEKSDRVFRYSWFKAKEAVSSQVNYGLMIAQNGNGVRTLTQAGYVYTYLTNFDANIYNATETPVSAGNFISSSGILLDKTTDETQPGMLEITKFNAGYVDYQYDVPTAGSYKITLRVSGKGEPMRYDPCVALYTVDSDGNILSTLSEPEIFEISGDDAVFADKSFYVTLEAGKQIIRVADGRPSRPSGIHISTITIKNTAAVESISDNVDSNFVAFYANGSIHFIANKDIISAEVFDINGRMILSGEVNNSYINSPIMSSGIYIVKAKNTIGEIEISKFIIKN